MRGAVRELATPHPIGESLPDIYRQDRFLARFTAALDEVLAPVFLTLDCLPAYLEPDIAPADFVDWLCSWIGIPAGPPARRRALLARAGDLYAIRGTPRALHSHLTLATGGEVEIRDSGGCTVSDEPGGGPPGRDGPPAVHIVVRLPDQAAVDTPGLDRLVRALVPAHVRVTLEVTTPR